MIRVTISTEHADPSREVMAIQGLKNSFRCEFEEARRDIRRTYLLLGRYLLAAIILLFVSVGIGYWLPASLPLDMLAAGTTIGAWVFMWEALGGVLLCHRETSPLHKRYQRFVNAPIICRRASASRTA